MQEFNFSTHLFFGPDALKRLDSVRNRRVLIITDHMIAECGILGRVTEHLVGCEISVFDRVVPDPPVEVVATGVATLLRHKANTLVAVGGGSVLDAAKVIRTVAEQDLEAVDTLECFAIPTTSGTGSEVTDVAVITDTEKGIKYPVVSPNLRPMTAILDPALVVSVPPAVTADTGMDVLTHALEAYVAKQANDFSDALCEKAISLVYHFLIPAWCDGTDLLAREKMHNASCMAGLAFNSAGLGLTHGLSHALGGKLHLPHGRLNAVLLPYIIQFNAQLDHMDQNGEFTVSRKYQRIAKILGLPASNLRVGVNSLIYAIRKINRTMGIPEKLQEWTKTSDNTEKMWEEVVEAALADPTTAANPRKATHKDLIGILAQASGKPAYSIPR